MPAQTSLLLRCPNWKVRAFDQRYAENELAYHREVIELVGEKFIPNIENAEVKALFVQGNEIFKAHEKHAAMMVKAVK